MAKSNLETVHLVSSEGTGFFYSVRRKKGKNKLSVKKYDPIARKHVTFAEKKLSRLKRKYKPGMAPIQEQEAAPAPAAEAATAKKTNAGKGKAPAA